MGSLAEQGLMQKSVIGMPASKGFSLLEILVVILIIGITLGFALLAFGDFGAERRVRVAAEHFMSIVQFAEQQAILEAGTLGIKVKPDSYQIFRFSPDGYWEAGSGSSIFKEQLFPSQVLAKLNNQAPTGEKPEIVINSFGNMTPFTLTLSSNQDNLLTIIGKADGQVTLTYEQK